MQKLINVYTRVTEDNEKIREQKAEAELGIARLQEKVKKLSAELGKIIVTSLLVFAYHKFYTLEIPSQSLRSNLSLTDRSQPMHVPHTNLKTSLTIL